MPRQMNHENLRIHRFHLLGIPFILFLLLIMGCGNSSSYNHVLEEADRLMEENPDSAYILLREVAEKDYGQDEKQKAYFNLLWTQACYKLYKPISSDSLIGFSVRYFERTGEKAFLGRAYYYQSMILYEQRKYEKALPLLKKCEEIAEASHDDILKSKVYESLCMVNYDVGYHELMLKYAQLFLQHSLYIKDVECIARGFSHVSTAYSNLGKEKEAQDYLLKTIPLLKNLTDVDRAYILANVGNMYKRQGDLKTSRYYLNQSIQAFPLPNAYKILGDVNVQENHLDEADSLWNKAMSVGDLELRISTASSVHDYFFKQHDYKKADQWSQLIIQLKDTFYQTSEKEKIAKIQHQYDHQVVEKQYYQALAYLFGAIIVAIILIAGIIVISGRKIKKYVSQIDIYTQQIATSQQQFEQLESKGDKHQKEIVRLYERISMLKQSINERVGRGKEVFNLIANGGKLPPMAEDENCLIEYYSIHYFATFHQWNTLYDKLTARLITYLILQEMGKDDEEIQTILSISNSAVRSIKSRIKSRRKP